MKRFRHSLFFCLLVSLITLTACGGGGESTGPEGATEEDSVGIALSEPSPEAVRAAELLTSRLANSEVVLVPSERGSAPIAYTQPRARRESNFIVTNFLVRNEASNALAGFQVDEFWFDENGNTVTGDRVRFREPILPQQVVAIELRVPRNSAMDRSNYEFSHQNGDIEPELVEELPEPEEEEEEEEEEDAEPAN